MDFHRDRPWRHLRYLWVEETRRPTAWRNVREGGLRSDASVECELTPRMEDAPRWRVDEARHVPGDGGGHRPLSPNVRKGRDKSLGVRVLRIREYVDGLFDFHHLSAVHDRDPFPRLRHDASVVGDQGH